jgi:hypothetical protein
MLGDIDAEIGLDNGLNVIGLFVFEVLNDFGELDSIVPFGLGNGEFFILSFEDSIGEVELILKAFE